MSEKRAKQVRRIARNLYKFHLSAWRINEPPRWRVFRYLKWKRKKPVFEDYEKQIKNISKKRG